MNDARVSGTQPLGTQRDPEAAVVGHDDFDGDGTADLLWRNAQAGTNELWLMQGLRATSRSLTPQPEGWRLAGTGDFDGDGTADLLWNESATGASEIWHLTGGAVRKRRPVDPGPKGFMLAGVADLDGDKRPDLLWQHPRRGHLQWWRLVGGAPVAVASLPRAGKRDRLLAVADLDGDGRDDLVWNAPRWRGDERRRWVMVWYMNGMGAPEGGRAAQLQRGEAFEGVVDVNGDGRRDLVLRRRDPEGLQPLAVERALAVLGKLDRGAMGTWSSAEVSLGRRPNPGWKVVSP
jgi:hypothetical protein